MSTEPRDLTARVQAEHSRRLVPIYRACDLCDHGRTLADCRMCADDALPQPMPVSLARRTGFPCGPDGVRMYVAAWER